MFSSSVHQHFKKNKNENCTITEVLEYGKSLIGVPYEWWVRGTIPHVAPMFALDNPPPHRSEITTCNCAGFVNLLLRFAGKKIPDHRTAGMGGTIAYWMVYEERGVLEKFDIKSSKTYPEGTLLLRQYRNSNDQGHVAVLINDIETQKQMVLHSITLLPYKDNSQKDRSKNLGINMKYTLEESHDGEYYDAIVRPKNWIL